VYGTDRRQWFRQAYGRSPFDDYELRCADFQRSWITDPAYRAQAARVRAYAEAKGGDVLTFAQTHWPHYWGLAMPRSLNEVCAEMGISEERTTELLTEIAEATREEQPAS
jgi:hypothetical protein